MHLHGDPALVAPDGRRYPLEPRAAALFALAAVEPGIARQRVASTLWADSDPQKARQALRQQLLRLRKLAQRDLFAEEDGLRLAADVGSDLARRGAGPFLGSHDYSDMGELGCWVARRRDERRAAAHMRLAQSLARAESEGELAQALEIAQRILASDTSSEEHHRNVIRLHYLRGDVSKAREAYEALCRVLDTEFGAQPSPETRQLERTLLRAAGAPSSHSPVAHVPPPSVLRPPRLIGRGAEWSRLESLWGTSAKAIVAGDSGMGKTRLISDFAATRGKVVATAARPGDALVAYSVLARLARSLVLFVSDALGTGLRGELARLLPELGEADPIRDRAGIARLMRSIEALLQLALDRGLSGLVIDDLHYADAASVEALQGTVVAESRLPVIVSCRIVELSVASRALVDALLEAGAASQIELQPLNEQEVAALLESLELTGFDARGLAGPIARHTGGNPMFILETVKSMLLRKGGAASDARLPVAESVTAAIAHRLGKLSAGAVKIARCAAVAGQDFSADLATKVLGIRSLDLADAWAELDAAHVLRDGGFAHDLIYEAALASVPAAIARHLHGDIAAYLEASGVGMGRVASHWRAANRPLEAGHAFIRAASEARDAGRRVEEAALLAEAAKCYDECGEHELRFNALLARADAMIYNDLGDATFAGVLAAEGAARNDAQRMTALLKKAELLNHRSDAAAAVDAGRRGIEMANAARRPDLSARFALAVAGGLCELRRVEEALQLIEPLRGWAEANLEPRALSDFLVQLGIAYDLASRLSDALHSFEAAREIAARHGFKDLLGTALSNLATSTSKRGELQRAVDYGRQAVMLFREAEPLKGTPLQTQTLLAHRLRDIGHYDEAIALFEEALAGFRRAGARHWIFSAAHRLALAWSQLGQHSRALKLMAEAPDGLPGKAQAIWMAHRAEIARASGGDGRTPLEKAMALLGDGMDDSNYRLVSLISTSILPAEEGESIATSVAAWAAARERFGMAAVAHSRAASCALAQGAVARAEPQIEAALRLFRDYQPDNFYRAEIWWTAAQVFTAVNRTAEAERVLEEGHQWVRRIADEHVREEFRDSFMHRNAINRALLAAPLRLSGAQELLKLTSRSGSDT